MAAAGARWGGVGEAWRGAAEGEPSGPVISPSVSEERRSLPPTLNGAVARLALLLLALALWASPAGAASWGSIEPGVSTVEHVRERYGPPSRETPKKVEGYDTLEWVYEGNRAPSGLIRLTIEFGLLAGTEFKPRVVRVFRLDPKPLMFGRNTIVDGWGVPDRIAQQGERDVFFYESGLVVTFAEDNISSATMVFMVPQKLPPPGAPPAAPAATPTAPPSPRPAPPRR